MLIHADARSTGLVTFNGGFGIGGRDTGVNIYEPGETFTLATGGYGESIRITKKQRLATFGIRGQRAGATERTIQFFGANTDNSGLCGQGVNILFDIRRATVGQSGNGLFTFKFSNEQTLAHRLRMLAVGGRGGCRLGTRVAAVVHYDFSDDAWDLRQWVAPEWYGRVTNGLFKSADQTLAQLGIKARTVDFLTGAQLPNGTIKLNRGSARPWHAATMYAGFYGLYQIEGNLPAMATPLETTL